MVVHHHRVVTLPDCLQHDKDSAECATQVVLGMVVVQMGGRYA